MKNKNGGLTHLHVDHGLFSLTISSATNISADHHAGDVITLSTSVTLIDATICFGVWSVANTL